MEDKIRKIFDEFDFSEAEELMKNIDPTDNNDTGLNETRIRNMVFEKLKVCANEAENETENETVNEAANETVNETVNEAANETVNEAENETVNEAVNEAANEAVNETVNETIKEVANEMTVQRADTDKKLEKNFDESKNVVPLENTGSVKHAKYMKYVKYAAACLVLVCGSFTLGRLVERSAQAPAGNTKVADATDGEASNTECPEDKNSDPGTQDTYQKDEMQKDKEYADDVMAGYGKDNGCKNDDKRKSEENDDADNTSSETKTDKIKKNASKKADKLHANNEKNDKNKNNYSRFITQDIEDVLIKAIDEIDMESFEERYNSLDELLKNTDIVVRGGKMSSRFINAGKNLYDVYAKFNVDTVLYDRTGEDISPKIKVIEGMAYNTKTNTVIHYNDYQYMKCDQEYILFLDRHNNGFYSITGISYGKIPLDEGEDNTSLNRAVLDNYGLSKLNDIINEARARFVVENDSKNKVVSENDSKNKSTAENDSKNKLTVENDAKPGEDMLTDNK
ncbi:MAG: hypothetical protein SOW12_03280 [Lachnospiraceae bacterium]|nr:hypothetical protein [Lachnospiraceae bacterium]